MATNGIKETQIVPAAAGATSKDTQKKKNVAGQEEFLTLLVHQLQNQDPLDPMKSEEFAVQLAQFSQLEQLIQINDKLGGDDTSAGSMASMAAFLGQQVVLKGDEGVTISAGKGPQLLLDMPAGSQSARVDFLNAEGKVVGSHVVEELEAGKQTISLDRVRVPNGTYDVRAMAVGESGRFVDVNARVTGVVEGFVLEPEPALLVNGQSVSLGSVVEVTRPSQAS